MISELEVFEPDKDLVGSQKSLILQGLQRLVKLPERKHGHLLLLDFDAMIEIPLQILLIEPIEKSVSLVEYH